MFLTEQLLDTIRQRAATLDKDNAYFTQDLQDLKEAGYLRAFVPKEFGGFGLSLDEMVYEQMALAGAAPATALAINMHQVWIGVARSVYSSGDNSMNFVFEEAVADEVFAFGVSEAGNDLVMFGSNSVATPCDDGGYAFTGTKIFTSNSPGWTRLGTFGAHCAQNGETLNVWGFLERSTPGITIKDDWDTLGMRASQSCTTVLDGAVARPDRIVRKLPSGASSDPFIFGIFAHFEVLLAAVYTGIARRALDVAVETVHKRMSKATGKPYAQDPAIRWRIADAAMELDTVFPLMRMAALDVDAGVDRGDLWFPQLSNVKSKATETALSVVEKAVRVSGGSSYFNRSELSRLYRDVLAGLFHPSDDESVHGAWAQALLGPQD